MKIVIALGGNALLKRGQELTLTNQHVNVEQACRVIAKIAQKYSVILTHGNGPQVGLLALQAAAYSQAGESTPFDVLDAESEGMIGYLLAQQLTNELPTQNIAALLTQIEVDPQDPAFKKPTKFIGPIYTQEQSAQITQAHPTWVIAKDGDYCRRVIASPQPQRILEINTIRLLVDSKALVICCGGGGIPVIRNQNGYRGVEAVIDKDLAAALLAEQLGADCLMMLTDVKAVMRHWGKPNAEPIKEMTLDELSSQTFATGSMGPKVQAAANFVKATGKKAYIGALEDAELILESRAGTLINPTV